MFLGHFFPFIALNKPGKWNKPSPLLQNFHLKFLAKATKIIHPTKFTNPKTQPAIP